MISLLVPVSFLNPKTSFFIEKEGKEEGRGEEGGGWGCAERDVNARVTKIDLPPL